MKLDLPDFPDDYFQPPKRRIRAFHSDELNETWYVDEYGCEVDPREENKP